MISHSRKPSANFSPDSKWQTTILFFTFYYEKKIFKPLSIILIQEGICRRQAPTNYYSLNRAKLFLEKLIVLHQNDCLFLIAMCCLPKRMKFWVTSYPILTEQIRQAKIDTSIFNSEELTKISTNGWCLSNHFYIHCIHSLLAFLKVELHRIAFFNGLRL